MRLRSKVAAVAAGFLFSTGLCFPRAGGAVDIVPFASKNQSPVAQIFGLPFAGSAVVVSPGRFEAQVVIDVANNFAADGNGRETVLLDGESSRYNLGVRYGLGERYELGVDIPFITYGGGFLDSFVEDWHRTFGMPDGGRPGAPRDRLLFRYTRDGVVRLLVNRSNGGIGDVRLSGGMQLFRKADTSSASVALRGSIKLPTGDSGQLHGSGSTDVALWLSAEEEYPTVLGTVAGYASGGGMVMSKGNILRDQQRPVVGFGSVGLGWAPADWIAFKVQLDANTPFFNGNGLREIDGPAMQLMMGGSLALSGSTVLDLGVSEDVLVNTAPDVGFHFALRQRF
jgi:hypothetical protein